MDNSRYYDNPFNDCLDNSTLCRPLVNEDTKQVNDDFKETLRTHTKSLVDQLMVEQKNVWTRKDDYSMYTGSAGIAYMLYHYGKCVNEPSYIDKAAELLKVCISKFRGRREITFLTGIAGPLALNAVILHTQGNVEESRNMISKLKSFSPYILEDVTLPDELLYGRAGYLFSLLFLNSNISPPPVEGELIKQVIAVIIHSGHTYSTSTTYKTPIMYAWHDSEYLGAAHGLAGILYLLLQARQYLTSSQLELEIKPALQFLQSLQYPSWNFPSSIGSRTDKLVHWCHGAPGMSMLFCLAYEIYQDDQYLNTALQCGEVVYSRGLLKKGCGICHGVAGNAYTFLSLFQQTKDVKHLDRACKFAFWCMDYGKHQMKLADRPFSLFEGIAGTIYFLIDMQNPLSAKFPGYTV
ncbi:lanC-like protein 2 [Hylaeus volcanicus]|uniref:lanC-like protein 2 n=1 Tax=Hylaeus volcanicus TaxID=313075 RepID=UPI0023B7BE57|nr:lanC-like protein 2 [Hylaeus volcanicus]